MISPGVEVIPSNEGNVSNDVSIGLTTDNSGNISEVKLNFLQHYRDGIKDIEKITQKVNPEDPNSADFSFEIYRGIIRLTPLDTERPIIFKDSFKYQMNNKGYDQYGSIFYIVNADDGLNSVYIWYYSDSGRPFHIETVTPIGCIAGVCF